MSIEKLPYAYLRPSRHPEMDVLHQLLSVPIDDPDDLKARKKSILKKLGFSSSPQMTAKTDFNINKPEDTVPLWAYITEQVLQKEQNLGIQIIDDRGKKGSGYPVVYLQKQEDMSRLIIEEGRLTGLLAIDGQQVAFGDAPKEVHVYVTQRSISAMMRGFTNYDQAEVRLGGGFRLQLDDIDLTQEEPRFIFYGVFAFNDVGARTTSLSNDYDYSIPYRIKPIILTFRKGEFVFEPNHPVLDLPQAVSSQEIDQFIDCLVGSLVKTEKGLSTLFSALLSVVPEYRTHSVAGVFSVLQQKDGQPALHQTAIDFDGVDTLTQFKNEDKRRITITDKLALAQLRKIGFISAIPGYEMAQFLKNIALRTSIILKSAMITPQIRSSIESHVENYFSPELTEPKSFARLLDVLQIPWIQGDVEGVSFYSKGENRFIMIDIEGLKMCYWLRNGKLENVSRLRQKAGKLSRVLGLKSGIVPAHFRYQREGE